MTKNPNTAASDNVTLTKTEIDTLLPIILRLATYARKADIRRVANSLFLLISKERYN